jgi:hypothetical protein
VSVKKETLGKEITEEEEEGGGGGGRKGVERTEDKKKAP